MKQFAKIIFVALLGRCQRSWQSLYFVGNRFVMIWCLALYSILWEIVDRMEWTWEVRIRSLKICTIVPLLSPLFLVRSWFHKRRLLFCFVSCLCQLLSCKDRRQVWWFILSRFWNLFGTCFYFLHHRGRPTLVVFEFMCGGYHVEIFWVNEDKEFNRIFALGFKLIVWKEGKNFGRVFGRY